MSERPASAAMLNVWSMEAMQRVHACHPENGAGRDRAAYLTAARDVLEHHAPALLRPGVTEWVCVVATMAQYEAAKGRPLPSKLLRELGVGVIAEELVRDWMDPAEAARLTNEVFDAFVEAIRPRVAIAGNQEDRRRTRTRTCVTLPVNPSLLSPRGTTE